MSRSLQFRHCIHQSPATGDVSSIVAAIRGDACGFRPSPRGVDALVVFQRVAQVIGPRRLAELWQAYRGEGRPEARDPRNFAPYLAGREVAQEHPALPDLARLDLGLFLAGLADREPSIAACCLPAGLISEHPDLMLRLQSSFRYLSLAYPVHTWVAGKGDLPNFAADQPILLRLAPNRSGNDVSIARDLLSPARFAFESSLARGRTFVAATKAAVLQDPGFDGQQGIASLISEGAIADVILHAKP